MAPSRKKRTPPRSKLGVDPLSPDLLRWRCHVDDLPFESTADVPPVAGVVGQETAVAALRFGLQTSAPGQNIFVRGLSGTGRLTLVERLLKEIKPAKKEVPDWCYVRNFVHPERPRHIALPTGSGKRFAHMVDRLAEFIRSNLADALSSDSIVQRLTVVQSTAQQQLDAIVRPFEEALRSTDLTLVSTEAGPVVETAIFPLVEGVAVAPEEFDQMHTAGQITDKHYQSVRESHQKFAEQLEEINEKATQVRRETQEHIERILEEATRSILSRMARDIKNAFPQPRVREFLDGLIDDVVEYHLHEESDADFTSLYRVNVIRATKKGDSCPIVVENAPTTRNLLGVIDAGPETQSGALPSHMGIRAGALVHASGGYLVVEDKEILNEPEAWKVLKRALRSGRLEMTSPEMGYPPGTPQLSPEPIDIDVKVIMLGDPETYAMLDELDRDFPQLFKVLADFDDVIPRNEEGVRHYAAVLSRIADEESLPPFDKLALAALAEHGARIAARGDKLTARFGRLADVAREAAFLARREGLNLVSGDHVRAAVRSGKQRANLPSRRFHEYVSDGTIRVEVKGRVIGQINGLGVLQAGPMIYGFPNRITATIGPGTAGVINIEGKAELSGAIHTKGFYILGGLMRHLLRTDHPLAFDASIAFEQSYGGIDGDSASGAEICCLLSALTEVPLRQDLAMTGAIDQMGHVLAVGAVNEKIEGFYDSCCDLEMTKTQGVIIPAANSGDLMLRHDVVEACKKGEFFVYAVDMIQQAIELLTGYPCEEVIQAAVARAREYWRKAGARPSGQRTS